MLDIDSILFASFVGIDHNALKTAGHGNDEGHTLPSMKENASDITFESRSDAGSPFSSDDGSLFGTPELKGIEYLKGEGLSFQLNTSLGVDANPTGQVGVNLGVEHDMVPIALGVTGMLQFCTGDIDRNLKTMLPKVEAPSYTSALFADSEPLQKKHTRPVQQPIGTPLPKVPPFSFSLNVRDVASPVDSVRSTTSICSAEDERVFATAKANSFGAITKPRPKSEDERVVTPARGTFGPIGPPPKAAPGPVAATVEDADQKLYDYCTAMGAAQVLNLCTYSLEDFITAAKESVSATLVNKDISAYTWDEEDEDVYDPSELHSLLAVLEDMAATLEACEAGINNFMAAASA